MAETEAYMIGCLTIYLKYITQVKYITIQCNGWILHWFSRSVQNSPTSLDETLPSHQLNIYKSLHISIPLLSACVPDAEVFMAHTFLSIRDLTNNIFMIFSYMFYYFFNGV